MQALGTKYIANTWELNLPNASAEALREGGLNNGNVMILSLHNRLNNQCVKVRLLYSRILLDQKAATAVTLLPKIAPRAIS